MERKYGEKGEALLQSIQSKLQDYKPKVGSRGNARVDARVRLGSRFRVTSTKPRIAHPMSSGTARLKRKLDEQGISYTNKRAVENFCLVRFVQFAEKCNHKRAPPCPDRHSTASPGEKGRQRIRSFMEARGMPDRFAFWL